MKEQKIELKKVCVHNLKNVSISLDPNQLIVFTGVSGSGKSSLAFDTIYVEGQRRYVESLSTYARRFLGAMHKPEAEKIEGISPTIAIEQKQGSKNPRSTVGTLTGIYDFLRVLYAKLATPYCPISGDIVSPQSTMQITDQIMTFMGAKLLILAPIIKGKKGNFKEEFNDLLKKGFTRVFIDNQLFSLNEVPALEESIPHDIDIVMDRIVVKQEEKTRIIESITAALDAGKGLLSIYDVDTKQKKLFSRFAYSEKSNLSYEPLDPQDFSFNHPHGMCLECEGIGKSLEFDESKIIDPKKSIKEDCCIIASSYNTVKWGNIYENVARIYHFDIDTPWKELPQQARDVFLYGAKEKWLKMIFVHPTKKTKWTDYIPYKGVIYEAKKRLNESTSDTYQQKVRSYMKESGCKSCKGTRIKAYPAAAKFKGLTIWEFCHLSIENAFLFLEQIILSPLEMSIGEELIKEIKNRLKFLINVGLHYLSLERSSPTLSGGEMQRVRLAAQIGCGLVGTTYILDEPSIGLHDRDHQRLLDSLLELKQQGNTVIVVEHDEATMRSADYIVDMGPGAGSSGGEIVAHGIYEDILTSPLSITGQYLSKKKRIEIPKKRRKSTEFIQIKGSAHHNLKQVDVKIPLHVFCAITGVSGSGKSSLIIDTLYPALFNHLHGSNLDVGANLSIEGIEKIDKIIEIDQSPIGRTSRSNPATYIKLFDDIRNLFAELPESKAFGYKPGQFSFNVKEGSCTYCSGLGYIKIDMDFLEDEIATCPECGGKRFDKKTLAVEFKGKNINDILNFSVDESLSFFENTPVIHRKIDLLMQVGLGYMKLGQSSTTLSGGEAQRIKLAKELSRPSTGNTLYILDEPTTGLHFEDINKLIQILQKLVDEKNSVIVIEHNLDLVKCADWIIDLGPEGGDEGGTIIGEGTPEMLIKKNTPTGIYLKSCMEETHIVTSSRQKTLPIIDEITVEGAYQNNLKGINVSIPRGKITICSGPSGSGKTSFALDTLYAEGQRRFVESLSPYAKQFIFTMQKPKVKKIEGLSPAIAIEQKKHAGNPRSIVGTITEVYDFLRILYAKEGKAFCPETNEPIIPISPSYVVNKLFEYPEQTKVQILAKLDVKHAEEFQKIKERLLQQGFIRIRLNDQYFHLEDDFPFNPTQKNDLYLVIDRITLKQDAIKRLLDAIEKASAMTKKQVTVAIEDKLIFFNLSFCVESTGKSYPSITPQLFSFNSEDGMCFNCFGLGFIYGASFEEQEELLELSILDLMGLLWKESGTSIAYKLLMKMLKNKNINPSTLIKDLTKEESNLLMNGSNEEIKFDENTFLKWEGISHVFEYLAKGGNSKIKLQLTPFLNQHICPECHGMRLNPLARNVKINHVSLPDFCKMPVVDALEFMKQFTKTAHQSMEEVLLQINAKLSFIIEIGLGYLSLDRSAPTLSSGEAQRIHLARQLGSGLTGCLYVLDEPTIGLHPYNNHLLNTALKKLCDLGNTLVVVEHDPMTIEIGDKIIDFGKGSGTNGGDIIAEGSLQEIKKNPNSLTGLYLTKKRIPHREIKSLNKTSYFSIQHANIHNLQNVNVQFPYGRLTCISGVSGCGKSTLLVDVIYKGAKQALRSGKTTRSFYINDIRYEGLEIFDDVIFIDQNPIGHTARSDVSTYIDLLTPLRMFYAALPDAAIRGLLSKHFSFNNLQGMCKSCFGLGYKTIDLQFLPSVQVTCPDCEGYRLNPLSLKVKYKGKHLGELLDLTIDDALQFLPPIPKVEKMITKLQQLGLGYLKLNQQVATLSCGEAQRLRLTRDLLKRSRGPTLYLLDEPTTGLHNEDIMKLLPILSSLVDKGHTVIIIEHHVDMILLSDYVVDLGPEGGKNGGKLVFSGNVASLLESKHSHTATFCNKHLSN
ncbi:MAG: excinuclease ABC subunit UvrA [Chlamydiales bacterium]|nr:excinuclease ABC subunit UvrA [Chlamydiales bacterium]